jgi:Domain of unknown function (DUF4351)
MPQSAINQQWREKFLLKNEQVQMLKDKLEKAQALIFRLLMRHIGAVSPELRTHINGLSLYQLEALDEALFNFTEARDLVRWLRENSTKSEGIIGNNDS